VSNLRKLLLCLLAIGFVAGSQGNLHSAVRYVGAPADPGVTLSSGTVILAKLLTNLDAEKCKPGDRVEAEITRDISQDHKVVVKKGSRLTGHVVGLSLSSNEKPQSRLGIVFENISIKNGGQIQVAVSLRALAREPQLQQQYELYDGRGTAATEITAGAALGGSVGGSLPNGELRPEDSGVYGLPGLSLAIMTTNKGLKLTIVTSADQNVRLAKGTQILLQVIGK
jgi:hypothetical protein